MGALPLQEHELVHTTDLEYAREMIGRIFVPHSLALIGRWARLDARVHVFRLTDTALNFVTYGGEVLIEPGTPDTFFTVHITLAGAGTFSCGSTDFATTPSIAAVVSPDDHLVMAWHPGCAQLICRVERPAFEAHLAGLIGEALRQPLRFRPVMRLAGSDRSNAGSRIRAIAHHIDHDRRTIAQPLSARAFEQSLMTDLLIAQPHNYSAALRTDVAPAAARVVRQAVALMESHPEWPLSLAGVATTLSVSGRSLQRAFHREFDATFRGVLHNIRLRRVRDDLRSAAPQAESVNAVIARWGLPLEGYTFAAYRRRYGESPLETLRSGVRA